MESAHYTFSLPRRAIYLLLVSAAICFLLLESAKSLKRPHLGLDPSEPSSQANTQSTTSKYAYATFLAETNNKADEEYYLIGTRMLIYQLLHDPETRTQRSIPFVVLVTPGVSVETRTRLELDGALVVEFPSITIDWLKPGRPRWEHVVDKLNIFKLTQFDKVLLMDVDIVILKRLDALFEEPETDVKENLGNPAEVRDDEGKQPQRYLMAGDSAPVGADKHTWPAPRRDIINAGFVVVHPSEEMFEHYLKVLSIDGRTPGVAPENQLWEYVHRLTGNMPFVHIKDTWIMNSPVYNDVKMGIAAVHEKWWRNSIRDKELRDVLLKSRWKMEGYWSHGQ